MQNDERRTQGLLEAVKKARAHYEERQDEVQAAKDAYYRAVRRLHESGVPLREVAEALGLSHQRVHQMIAESQDAKKARVARRAKRAAGTAGAVLIAIGIVGGAWSWFQGDGEDSKPQPVATDRLAQSPSSLGKNVDITVQLEDLRRTHRRLRWALRAPGAHTWVIETPVEGPNLGLRFWTRQSVRRVMNHLVK